MKPYSSSAAKLVDFVATASLVVVFVWGAVLFWGFNACVDLFKKAISRVCQKHYTRHSSAPNNVTAMTKTATLPSQTLPTESYTCPICLENHIELRMSLTESCNHTFCKPCIKGWMLHLERSNVDHPSCPECRFSISEKEIISILGRPLRQNSSLTSPSSFPSTPSSSLPPWYRQSGSSTVSINDHFDPDEFTKTYLEELEDLGIARRCPSCRI